MKKVVFLCLISLALHAADNDPETLNQQEVSTVTNFDPQNLHMVDQQTLDALSTLDIEQVEYCASCRDCYTNCSNNCPVFYPETNREANFCTGGLIFGAFMMCLFGGI